MAINKLIVIFSIGIICGSVLQFVLSLSTSKVIKKRHYNKGFTAGIILMSKTTIANARKDGRVNDVAIERFMEAMVKAQLPKKRKIFQWQKDKVHSYYEKKRQSSISDPRRKLKVYARRNGKMEDLRTHFLNVVANAKICSRYKLTVVCNTDGYAELKAMLSDNQWFHEERYPVELLGMPVHTTDRLDKETDWPTVIMMRRIDADAYIEGVCDLEVCKVVETIRIAPDVTKPKYDGKKPGKTVYDEMRKDSIENKEDEDYFYKLFEVDVSEDQGRAIGHDNKKE